MKGLSWRKRQAIVRWDIFPGKIPVLRIKLPLKLLPRIGVTRLANLHHKKKNNDYKPRDIVAAWSGG